MRRPLLGIATILCCAGLGLGFTGAVTYLLAPGDVGAPLLAVAVAFLVGSGLAGVLGHAIPEEL